MRVHIGADHAGWELSRALEAVLHAQGYDVVNHVSGHYDPDDDYPAFCLRAARAVYADQRAGADVLGVVIGGSGNGEQIAANKVKGIRAALVWNHDTAVLARRHNNANVAAIGARQHEEPEALALVKAFLDEPFSWSERHERRIRQIGLYENSGELSAGKASEVFV